MGKEIKLSPKYGLNPTIPVCFWCGKDKNEVALLGHIGNGKKHEDFEAPMHMVLDYEPCEECEKAMAMGFTVMEATRTPNEVTDREMQSGVYPTGKWAVLTHEAAARIFPDAENFSKAFLEMGVYDKIIG